MDVVKLHKDRKLLKDAISKLEINIGNLFLAANKTGYPYDHGYGDKRWHGMMASIEKKRKELLDLKAQLAELEKCSECEWPASEFPIPSQVDPHPPLCFLHYAIKRAPKL